MIDGNEYLDLPIPETDAPATFENILQFIEAFSVFAHLDGKGWKHFRGEILNFANREVRELPGEGICRIQDIGPRLWGFFRGYMACHRFYLSELNSFIKEIKPK